LPIADRSSSAKGSFNRWRFTLAVESSFRSLEFVAPAALIPLLIHRRWAIKRCTPFMESCVQLKMICTCENYSFLERMSTPGIQAVCSSCLQWLFRFEAAPLEKVGENDRMTVS
jgi:hypothetical protein